jgi:hypothetical protein
LSKYSEWREEADPQLLEAFNFYGTYLVGQTNGLSDALNLQAVAAALEIDEIERAEWPEMTRRMLQIHSGIMEIVRAKEKRTARRG